jgi:hypothetical protein
MPVVKVSFHDDDMPMLRLAAGAEKVSAYCRRVVVADLSRHRSKIARHRDALEAEVVRILAKYLPERFPDRKESPNV